MLTFLVRQVLRHYPFMTPRASLLKLLPPAPADYGPFGISDGLQIVAYPAESSDHVVKSLFWLGSFDPWVCSTLKSLVIPGTAVLDIGANIGLMTMLMSKVAGPDGRVYSFEPAPETCTRLRSNVAANSLSNVEIHAIALSDRAGVCHMFVPDGQDGMARIGQREPQTSGFDVPMITFDEWVSSRQLGRISVCKIDVEGHEPNVLEGMKATLSSGMIDSIVFEDHAVPSESLTHQTLRSHGYQIFRMFKTLLHVRYHRVGEVGRGAPTADYVAVRSHSDAFSRLSKAGTRDM